jgi:hypothetical protein
MAVSRSRVEVSRRGDIVELENQDASLGDALYLLA